MLRCTSVLCGLGLLVGCGGTDATGPDAAACTVNCQSAALLGASNLVTVTHEASAPSFTQIEGVAYSPAPPSIFSITATRSGCRWLSYDGNACGAPCEFGQFCAAGTCQTWPEGTDLGALTIAGVRTAPITLTAQLGGGYQWADEGTLAANDISLTVDASQGFVPATITARMPQPLVPDHDWSAALDARAAGADVALRWQAPDPGARIYLRMTTGIGTHGGISPVEVECDVEDTGTLTLPGDQLDALFADGWACGECGLNEVYRYRAGAADVGLPDPLVFALQTRSTFYFHP